MSLVDRQSLTPICWRALAEFGLAMAKAERSEFLGDSDGAGQALAEANGLAADLRLALRSAVDDVQLDRLTAVEFYQRSWEVDQASGQKQGDQMTSQTRARDRDSWLAELLATSYRYCHDTFSAPLLANLLATAQLRRQGRGGYEGTLEDLLKSGEKADDAFKSSGNSDDAPPSPNSL